MRKLSTLLTLTLVASSAIAQGRAENSLPEVGIPKIQPVSQGQPASAPKAAPANQSVELMPPRSVFPSQTQQTFQDPFFASPDNSSGAAAVAERPLGPVGRFWLRGEYLLWWTKGSQLPPLITTGIPGASPLPGALGQTGTTVVYGNSDLGNQPRSGGRFTGGFLFDPCLTFGVDASYFFLAPRTTRFDAASNATLGSPLIARPFFDVLAGTQNAQLVAFPALANGSNILTATGTGLASGDIYASSYSRFQGADLNVFCGLCAGCNYWVQMLVGARWLQLNEGIEISETSRVNPALPVAAPFFGGSTITINDQFDTRNNFYGGQVGLRGEVRSGKMFLEFQGKLAIGVTHQAVEIHGTTAMTPPGGVQTVTPLGFLASGSNSGLHERNKFSVVPEVGINAGAQITNNVRVFVGYNFLYWSSVVRPADQIDLNLNGSQIPTDTRFNPAARPASPVVLFRDTGFWAHGISFGAEVRF